MYLCAVLHKVTYARKAAQKRGLKLKKKGHKKENGELRLTDKRHPVSGIASSVLAAVSFISFAAACIISGRNGGNAGFGIGLIGISCLLVSITGFIMAWISLHQENIRPLFPTIGSLANGLLVITYMVLYILGV